MGLLDALSGALTAGTEAAAGQEQGKLQGSQMLRAIQLQQVSEQEKQAQAEESLARAKSLMKPKRTSATFSSGGKPVMGSMDDAGSYYDASGQPVRDVEPFQKPTAPLPGSPEWKQAKIDEAKIGAQYGYHPPAQQPLVVTADPSNPAGPGVYTPRDQAAGKSVPTKAGAAGGALAAPMAAKVGQYGEMLKKAADLFPSMEALGVSLANSAAQDIATQGVGIGHMRIPGTQGVGAAMVNKTPEYSTYQAALTPFVLAAAHALSGARINDEQVKQIRASIEIKPGESPQSRAQKQKNLTDLVNSIGGSLPPDAVAQQEGQMEDGQRQILASHGYRGSTARTLAPSGNVDLRQPASKGVSPLRAKYDAAVAHLKATGRESEIPQLPLPPED